MTSDVDREGASQARWFVAHTLPRSEATATSHLERQGFETFLPTIVTTRRHARKFETRKEALFPRYVFVRFDPLRHQWRSINGTTGVSSLVMGRELPIPTPNGLVEELIARTDAEGLIEREPGLAPGDPVRIVVGPMAGMSGTLISLDPKGRVEMLLALISGSVRVKVARDILRPAS